MWLFKTKIVCMFNHAHNNIRDTSIYLLPLYIYITCENRRKIMLENAEHYVNDISFIISKLNWITWQVDYWLVPNQF